MSVDIAILIVGFVILGFAADRFVWGASGIASHWGIRPAVIGLTIVALGTSAPEIFVSLDAAWRGSQGIAVGNVLGSNIANIGMVLGVAALTAPMVIKPSLYRLEMLFLLFFTLLTGILLYNLFLGPVDGLFLIAGLMIFLGWLLWSSLHLKSQSTIEKEYKKEIPQKIKPAYACLGFLLGLVFMLVSAHYIVSAAIRLARAFGVSDWIIGLTVIAFGTSLPEAVTGVIGVLKKEYDIVLGNVIGSNLFNLLAVLPIAGLLVPQHVDAVVLKRDYVLVAVFTAALALLLFRPGKTVRIQRWHGAVLLLGYVSYIVYLTN